MQKSFHKSINELFPICLDVLRKLEINIIYKNKSEGIITGETASSIWSWGESISIKLEKAGNNTVVKVKSDSKAQLIDWGKNQRNEENILNTIAAKVR